MPRGSSCAYSFGTRRTKRQKPLRRTKYSGMVWRKNVIRNVVRFVVHSLPNKSSKNRDSLIHATILLSDGGGSGIRTHDTVSRIHAFQACALSHSAIPPGQLQRGQYNPARSGEKPAPRSRDLPQRRERNRSINPTHVARLAYVVAAEFARAVAERRHA